MRSMRIAVLVGVMVVLGALPAAAQGALVLDQSQEDVTVGFTVGDPEPSDDFPRFTIAQTFTAGLSGPLRKVELYLSKLNIVVGDPPPPLPITVEIRTVDGVTGNPTTTVLATATIPASAIPTAQEPGWVPAVFGLPAPVVAGTQYAIVAYTDSAYSWHGSSGVVDAYTGGSRRISDEDSPEWRIGCGMCIPDMAFRTFVALRSLPAVVNLSTNFTLGDSLPTPSVFTAFAYGSRPQVPIMGDWDGDGTGTAGAYKGGVFNLNNQNDGSAPDITFAFGDPRGFPVVGDYDGDGTEDVALYRNGLWQVRLSTGDTYTTTFGTGSWPATVPVAGDWDGDGTDGIGTYTYANATWALRNSPTGSGGADAGTFVFGTPASSYPVPGDWDADGTGTAGVKTGTTWTLRNSNTPGPAEITFNFGGANDLPLTWRMIPPAG